ncbi:MAG: glucose-1-phosphate adenylyltransferase [Nitrospirae bacterium]|nr:glucose-1-phosphate adenylyltransferase [Nitrospirota bacterium]
MNHVLALVLAGGKGERLHPLTLDRAKPAVPFGGKYRIIDFTLSNCINSNLRRIVVVTQYKSLSLDRHLALGWEHLLNPELGEYIFSVPPQQRIDERWYQGTADAVFQNIYLIEKENPRYILVLSGDHVYKMNYADMFDYHVRNGAAGTVATIKIDKKDAGAFGIVEVDAGSRIIGFHEKPESPVTIPGDPEHCYASMGLYLFNTDEIISELRADSVTSSAHDFGKNILPAMMGCGGLYAYEFKDENRKEAKYWRDVGTIDAYWEANMDLVSVDPHFNLYDRDWPVRTNQGQYPPAKFVFAQEYKGGRLGISLDSIISGGCIISGGRVQNSVLSPNVRVNSFVDIRESILMENVEIGRSCRIRKAIIDKDVYVPSGTIIGYDPEADRERFVVSEGGVVVIPKGAEIR